MDKIGDSKRVQLEILMTRIVLHGNRMWQLPLTYLGLIAISLSVMTEDKLLFSKSMITILLTVLGIIMTWCLYGAHRRYQETVDDANELETELQIRTYTKCDSFHTFPYYALMIFGITCSLLGSVFLLYNGH